MPDYRGTVSADQIIAAYAWTVSDALVALATYAVLHRWVFHSNHARRTLVRLFAACAVCTYYWYRIPALTGFDPTGSGMLVDLRETLPSLPLISRTLTTTFFVWFLMVLKDGRSWMMRPVARMTPFYDVAVSNARARHYTFALRSPRPYTRSPPHMITLSLPLKILLAALGTLALYSTAAAGSCPVVDNQTVEAAFADSAIRHADGDASGSCGWIFEDGASLMVHVQKRPTAAETAALFQSYRSAVFGTLTRAAATPKIGQRAVMGMSPSGAARGEAGLMVLDKDSLIVVSYYGNQGEELDPAVLASLERVGRSATGNKAGADQRFGQCEWLPTRDMDALLGKKKRTVQRLGPNHCIASTQPSGVLMVMTDTSINEESFANIRESHQGNCTVVLLPEFGPNAHAVFDCNPRGNPVMIVELLKNGTHATVSLSAPGRAALAGDIEAMKPLLRHVFERL